MKLSLVLLSLTFAFSAFASPQGQVVGSCTVNNRVHTFTVNPGEKMGLGLFIGEEGEAESIYNVWSIEVANYAGTSLQPVWGGFFMGIARPIGTRVVVDPPMLCPRHPESLRLHCERVNADRLPKLDVTTDAFTVSTGSSAPSARDVWRMNLPQELEVVLDRLVNGELPVTCTAKFTEI